jgi:hypothetical protein
MKMNNVSSALRSDTDTPPPPPLSLSLSLYIYIYIYICTHWNIIQKKNESVRDKTDASLKIPFATLTTQSTNISPTEITLLKEHNE